MSDGNNINSLILIGPTGVDEIVTLNQEIHSDCNKHVCLSQPNADELQKTNSTELQKLFEELTRR
jgi:hypothetical protein